MCLNVQAVLQAMVQNLLSQMTVLMRALPLPRQAHPPQLMRPELAAAPERGKQQLLQLPTVTAQHLLATLRAVLAAVQRTLLLANQVSLLSCANAAWPNHIPALQPYILHSDITDVKQNQAARLLVDIVTLHKHRLNRCMFLTRVRSLLTCHHALQRMKTMLKFCVICLRELAL